MIMHFLQPEEIRASYRTQRPEVIHASCWHWLLHEMSITPNIIMICIDIQGEEHHCREEQEIVGFLGNPRVEQKYPANRNARSNQFERYSCYGCPDWAHSDLRYTPHRA
jgi:hypothetical protein